MKIDQNTESESDLEDNIDELMNDWNTDLVFEKEDSEKGDVSDGRRNILIPEVNIHVKHPEDSEEHSQKDRVDVPKAKENPKDSQKKRVKEWEKRREREKIRLNWWYLWKKASTHPIR